MASSAAVGDIPLVTPPTPTVVISKPSSIITPPFSIIIADDSNWNCSRTFVVVILLFIAGLFLVFFLVFDDRFYEKNLLDDLLKFFKFRFHCLLIISFSYYFHYSNRTVDLISFFLLFSRYRYIHLFFISKNKFFEIYTV